jgi:hypothetical protein
MPPLGHGDQDSEQGGRRVGSRTLRARLQQTRPALLVCGHLHAGYGHSLLPWADQQGPQPAAADSEQGHGTVCVNCAVCDEDYRPTHAPYLVELVAASDLAAMPAL